LADLIEPKEKKELFKAGMEQAKALNEQYEEGLLSNIEKKSKLILI
jgi:hypothetical protein